MVGAGLEVLASVVFSSSFTVDVEVSESGSGSLASAGLRVPTSSVFSCSSSLMVMAEVSDSSSGSLAGLESQVRCCETTQEDKTLLNEDLQS